MINDILARLDEAADVAMAEFISAQEDPCDDGEEWQKVRSGMVAAARHAILAELDAAGIPVSSLIAGTMVAADVETMKQHFSQVAEMTGWIAEYLERDGAKPEDVAAIRATLPAIAMFPAPKLEH